MVRQCRVVAVDGVCLLDGGMTDSFDVVRESELDLPESEECYSPRCHNNAEGTLNI